MALAQILGRRPQLFRALDHMARLDGRNRALITRSL
jgi:hypothetical protein